MSKDPESTEAPGPQKEPEETTQVVQTQRAPMSLRRRNRLVAVQFLYSWELNPGEAIEYALEQYFREYELNPEKYAFAETLIRGTLVHKAQIDSTLEGSLKNWRLDRIAKTDLSILRLATYELLHRNDIPPITSINEAIELSKLLCERESKGFINGILDSLKHQLLRPLRQATSS